MKFEPNKYMTAIFDWIRDPSKRHAVIEAVAGSGKTTTLLESIQIIRGNNPRARILLCAFNKSIQRELEDKIRRAMASQQRMGSSSAKAVQGIDVKTYHALGFSILRQNTDHKVRTDGGKTHKLLRERVPDFNDRRRIQGVVQRLVGLVKSTLATPTEAVQQRLLEDYGLETNGADLDEVFEHVRSIIERGRAWKSTIDFDDMIYETALGILESGWRVPKYDWVLSDESQDLNEAQRVLLKSVLADDGRMIAVGDSRQAIYGFRGASPDSMKRLRESLEAETLPLSICYRCPTSVIERAQKIVPEIEAHENAPEGKVVDLGREEALRQMGEGDMVLCRTNAPLVKAAFRLLAEGRPAMVKGRNIGQGLIALIDKFDPSSVDDLILHLSDYMIQEADKLERRERFHALEMLRDKVDCLMVLADRVDDIASLRREIKNLFNDSVSGTCFSSIHRAKGLESDRVYILQPDKMPLIWKGQKPWQFEQEENIIYVALTRSANELYYIRESGNVQAVEAKDDANENSSTV